MAHASIFGPSTDVRRAAVPTVPTTSTFKNTKTVSNVNHTASNVNHTTSVLPDGCPLLDKLPPEILNRIFAFILVSDQELIANNLILMHGYSTADGCKLAVREPDLLRTCKAIRSGYTKLFYGMNTFLVYNHRVALRFICCLGKQRAALIRALKIANLFGFAHTEESYYAEVIWHVNYMNRFLGKKALRPEIIHVEMLYKQASEYNIVWTKIVDVKKFDVIRTANGDWHVELHKKKEKKAT